MRVRLALLALLALGRAASAQQTPELLARLEETHPLAGGVEGRAARLLALKQLAAEADPAAAPTLRRIVQAPAADAATRLAAAAALARLGTQADRRAARRIVFWFDDEAWHGIYRDLHVSGPFAPADLDRALSAVGDAEARARLAARLLASAVIDEKMVIIDLIARHPDAAGRRALLCLSQRNREESQVRRRASEELERSMSFVR
jgi:hypothetical protein